MNQVEDGAVLAAEQRGRAVIERHWTNAIRHRDPTGRALAVTGVSLDDSDRAARSVWHPGAGAALAADTA